MKGISVLFLFLSSFVHSQNWLSITAVPSVGRDDAVAFSLNGFGFVVTGNLGGFTESNKLFQYDAHTNSWTEKATFPGTARQYSSVFVLENKAYLIGGYSETGLALKDVWEYNSFTDSWTQKNDFPGFARWHATATSIRNTAYFGMGTTADSTLSDFWKYIPDSDSWLQLASYPGGPNRSVLGFPLLDDLIFGEGFDINPISYSGSWYSFHSTTETWSSFPDLPAGKRAYGTAISNGFSAVVCGGMDENSVFHNDCYYLDHTKKWQSASPLPVNGLRGAKGFSLNGNFFIGTGLNQDAVRVSDFYQWNSIPKTPSESILFPNPSNDYFRLITEGNARVSVFNIGGYLVKQYQANDAGFLEITNLPIGLFLVFIEGKDRTEVRKIVHN